MTQALKDLRDQVARMLDEARANVGEMGSDHSVFFQRRRNEEANLARRLTSAFDARTKVDFRGAAVSIAGIRSTSTSGLFGAVQNWLVASGKRIGGQS
ncbi:hypothetical protein [Stappia indica]|uniref:Uncharacterized protein n=1 Tax=Stappia indica TaxID=538381 RepID=A0A285TSQ0_9HYPH|nr:hypothetical protein [Stappia indica]SOC26973.1 hypothetical protein SAMN05421512_11733 [Stappia indica]